MALQKGQSKGPFQSHVWESPRLAMQPTVKVVFFTLESGVQLLAFSEFTFEFDFFMSKDLLFQASYFILKVVILSELISSYRK